MPETNISEIVKRVENRGHGLMMVTDNVSDREEYVPNPLDVDIDVLASEIFKLGAQIVVIWAPLINQCDQREDDRMVVFCDNRQDKNLVKKFLKSGAIIYEEITDSKYTKYNIFYQDNCNTLEHSDPEDSPPTLEEWVIIPLLEILADRG